MRRIGAILAAVAGAARALFGAKVAVAAIPPNQFNAADPVPRNARPPRRSPGWATLIWDSGHLGPAYRVHDRFGRPMYTRLHDIPAAKRVPRRTRRDHEAGQARAAGRFARA